jgi:hypothetical protein
VRLLPRIRDFVFERLCDVHFVGQAVPHDERGEGGDVAAESAILSGVIDIRESRSHSIAE